MDEFIRCFQRLDCWQCEFVWMNTLLGGRNGFMGIINYIFSLKYVIELLIGMERLSYGSHRAATAESQLDPDGRLWLVVGVGHVRHPKT